ncbi:hypothetical protein ACIHCQ_41380 [Streptomyces sp. NPDC052236]|uniref:hypothetical protein n=1 Tax=Streptomyces sp. NPDC052236 TaxID=3365686 RepID=UPI0037CF56ED
MNDSVVDDWSPANHPYSIAVSEAQWWKSTAALAVRRIHAGDDAVGGFETRQIDARQLCLALRQLLMAEKLEQIALAELGIDPAAGQALEQARKRFEAALPGIKHMRDGLIHFEDWSRGKGFGPQQKRVKAGDAPRDVARAFWGFGYDPATTPSPWAPTGSRSAPSTRPPANSPMRFTWPRTRSTRRTTPNCTPRSPTRSPVLGSPAPRMKRCRSLRAATAGYGCPSSLGLFPVSPSAMSSPRGWSWPLLTLLSVLPRRCRSHPMTWQNA